MPCTNLQTQLSVCRIARTHDILSHNTAMYLYATVHDIRQTTDGLPKSFCKSAVNHTSRLSITYHSTIFVPEPASSQGTIESFIDTNAPTLSDHNRSMSVVILVTRDSCSQNAPVPFCWPAAGCVCYCSSPARWTMTAGQSAGS